MKFVGGIALGLIIASAFFLSRPAAVPEKTKKEFQTFSVNEAKDFAEARTPDEKLKAAEALYGKMMILFLADLGLQLQKSTPVEFSPEKESAEKENPVAVSTPELPKEIAKIECAPCAVEEKKKEEKKKLTTADKFKSTGYVTKMEPIIRNMNGSYLGKLTYFAGNRKGKIDGASMSVNLFQRDEHLEGAIQVLLTNAETGEPYSNNRGNGGNKTIRYDQSDRMVYVEASPDSFFAFRAGEFNRSEIRGEYYEANALVGKAIFYRQ